MVVQKIMFKYRIYPSKKQNVKLINSLITCKIIYNELLDISQKTYREKKKSLGKLDYNKIVKGRFKHIHSQVAQNVGNRLYKAFQNFFRRVKNKSCKKKGFPRYKSRVNSITFPQSGFKLLSDKRLRLSKIGSVPVVLHRIPKGKIKTLTIKQNKIGQWFAIFVCELPESKVVHTSTEKVGIDVGLENFATLSNGEVVSDPKYLIQSERRLKRLQRRLSRKVKGSANRRKARIRVAKQYIKITNQRADFLHKLSRKIAVKYGTIAVEQLQIKNMVKNHYLAKSISDASWGTFINMLSYKAVTCGGQLVKNPKTRGSSHRCSKCGHYVEKMPLHKRTFNCPSCGFVSHRDLNASLNHNKDTVGLTGISTPVDIEPLPSSNGKASLVVESGTKCDI